MYIQAEKYCFSFDLVLLWRIKVLTLTILESFISCNRCFHLRLYKINPSRIAQVNYWCVYIYIYIYGQVQMKTHFSLWTWEQPRARHIAYELSCLSLMPKWIEDIMLDFFRDHKSLISMVFFHRLDFWP